MKINFDINLGVHVDKSIGLQFGSYDPAHEGHIDTSMRLKKEGGLDEVWLLPIPQSPYKKHEQVPFADKVEMCKILAAPHGDWLKVSDACANFPNTATGHLQHLKRTIEGFFNTNSGTKFSIVAGEDFSKKFNEVVAGMAYLSMAVNTCKNMSIFNFQMLNNFADRISRANDVLQKLEVISAPRATLPIMGEDGQVIDQVEVSSKHIRAAFRAGAENVIGIPPPLRDYIVQHDLYSAHHP